MELTAAVKRDYFSKSCYEETKMNAVWCEWMKYCWFKNDMGYNS